MNNKGFSVIELLSVIAIIAIILLIFTPSVINIIDDFKNKKNIEMLEKSAISAAKEYVADGNADYKVKTELSGVCSSDVEIEIDIQGDGDSLVSKKYLSYNDHYKDKTITITYDCNNKKFINYVFNK